MCRSFNLQLSDVQIQQILIDEQLNLLGQSIGGIEPAVQLSLRHLYDGSDQRILTILPRGNRIQRCYNERHLQVVADVPEFGLSAGEVGAVVEELGGEAFEVEFCDPDGSTYAMHTLRAGQLVPLHTRGEALRLRAGAA